MDKDKTFMERLDEAAKSQGLSIMRMQTMLGYSNSYFRNVGKINYDAAKKFSQRFPSLNVNWINTGEGSMYVTSSENFHTVPLLPISAQGGSLLDFEAQIKEHDCERIVSPIKEATMAIPVTGDSMSPEYPSGCKVFVKKIDEEIFIDWGRTYVLDTLNGTVIKNIFPSTDSSKVLCRSVNPNFPDFEIKKEDIRGWYRVLLMFALK